MSVAESAAASVIGSVAVTHVELVCSGHASKSKRIWPIKLQIVPILSLLFRMNTTNQLDIVNVSLQSIRALAPIVRKIRSQDKDLADQIRRAASSVALNLGEGLGSTGGTQRARFESARGSLRETRMALQVACEWGHVERETITEADALLDRIGAMLYRLSRR